MLFCLFNMALLAAVINLLGLPQGCPTINNQYNKCDDPNRADHALGRSQVHERHQCNNQSNSINQLLINQSINQFKYQSSQLLVNQSIINQSINSNINQVNKQWNERKNMCCTRPVALRCEGIRKHQEFQPRYS